MVTAVAPAKLILFGEHAVVYGKPAIATATGILTRATVEESDETIIEAYSFDNPVKDIEPIKALVKEAIVRYDFSGLRIHIRSFVPMGAGLGSSASAAVAVAAAIVKLAHGELILDEVIELADIAETIAHGKPSGIDTRIIAYGGTMLYIKGKKPIFTENLAGPITIFSTGIPRSTRDLVLSVKALKERNQIAAKTIDLIGELVNSVRKKINEGPVHTSDIKEEAWINHGLLQAIGVSHPVLDLLVYEAKKHGYGAKLTGAGGGGSVIGFGIVDIWDDLRHDEDFIKLMRKYGSKYDLIINALVGSKGVRIV